MVSALSANIGSQQAQFVQSIRDRYAQADLDGSGDLSLEEFEIGAPDDAKAAASGVFSDFDANSDGSLSEDEFTAFFESSPPPPQQDLLSGDVSQQLQSLFQNVDSDSDGLVSFEEFEAGAPDDAPSDQEELFASLDADSSGSLTEEELAAGLSQGAGPAGKAGGPPPGGGPPPSSGDEDEETSYDSRDLNEDGVVSADELAAASDDGQSSATVSDTLSFLVSLQSS